MLDKKVSINIDNKDYPLAYDLNVIEIIQEKYGTMDKWYDKLSGGKTGEVRIGDIIWIFKEMFNEGIEIHNDENNDTMPSVTLKQAGRLISKYGPKEATEKLKEMVTDKEAEENPNVMTSQNQ